MITVPKDVLGKIGRGECIIMYDWCQSCVHQAVPPGTEPCGSCTQTWRILSRDIHPPLFLSVNDVTVKPRKQADPYAEADPYADLKAAHAAGKTIQHSGLVAVAANWIDIDYKPVWSDRVERYRVKPEEPAAEQQATPDADGWITWGGGECPVAGETLVEVRRRNGLICIAPASMLGWKYETNVKSWGHEIRHDDSDIVAYRVVKAVEQPATPAAEPQAERYVFFAVGDSSASEETVGQSGGVLEPDATVSAAINRLTTACATGDDGPVTAHSVLQRAANHMSVRAAIYDYPGGERSMDKAVLAFNAITGRDLDASEGWLLLQQLKNVRLFTADGYHKDSAEDAAAYTALMAEAKAHEADQDAKLVSLLAGGAQ